MEVQKAFSWDTVTLKKIGKSALLCIAGVFLAFLSDNLSQLIAATPFTKEQAMYAVGILAWLINAAREYIKGQK